MMIATGLAVLVHAVGLVGILFIDRAFFISMTPVNLLLMQVLVWWTSPAEKSVHLGSLLFLASIGMVVEWTGVHTGFLFGSYAYGDHLGPKCWKVPLLIGGNWFLVITGSLSLALYLRDQLAERFFDGRALKRPGLLSFAVPFTAALMATAFDRIMEPAAIRLGFWSWSGGNVPLYNYICWFAVSLLVLLAAGNQLRPVATIFARRLLFVQAFFFLLVALSR